MGRPDRSVDHSMGLGSTKIIGCGGWSGEVNVQVEFVPHRDLEKADSPDRIGWAMTVSSRRAFRCRPVASLDLPFWSCCFWLVPLVPVATTIAGTTGENSSDVPTLTCFTSTLYSNPPIIVRSK